MTTNVEQYQAYRRKCADTNRTALDYDAWLDERHEEREAYWNACDIEGVDY